MKRTPRKTNTTAQSVNVNPIDAFLGSITPGNAIDVMEAAFGHGFDFNVKEDNETGDCYVSIEIEIRGEPALIMSDELDRQIEEQERKSKAAARKTLQRARRDPEFRALVNQMRERIGAPAI